MMNLRPMVWVVLLVLCPVVLPGQSIQLADSLFKQGAEYDTRGNMREAEFYYGEAYNIYRQQGDTLSWINAGKKYASALVYRSEYERAMNLYEMLLSIDHPANDAYNRGDIYNSMGWASRRNGKLDRALDYYHESLPLALESGDSVLIGVVHDNMGRVHSSRGDYGQALHLRQKALQFFQGIDNPRRVAITLNNIGSIYNSLSLYDKALDHFNRSLKIRQDIGNVNLLATIYNNIADVQMELGHFSQALVSYQKTLEYRDQAGDIQGRAITLNNLGLLYKNLGEYERALDYYEQSLAVSEEVSGMASVATTTRNIAMILLEEGQHERAAELCLKAMELRKEIGNPYDIATSLNDMIRIELEGGNPESAEIFVRELETIADSTGNYGFYKDTYQWHGKIANRKGKLRAAIAHHRRAYEYSRYLPSRQQIHPLKELARAYHRAGSDSALVYGQKAVSIIEEHRSRAGAVSDLRSGYFERHSGFYIDLASWLLTYRQDYGEAYRMVELAKARSLSDELAEAALNIEQHLPEEVRIEQNEMKRRIDELYAELEAVNDPARMSSIQREIRNAELNFAAFQNRIRSEYPEFDKLEVPSPVSVEEAQALNDNETAVLEYAVSGNHLIMFLITRDRVHAEQVAVRDERSDSLEIELTEQVAEFRDAILSNAPLPELEEYSAPLYDMLIKPFEDELDGYKNLVIVPDGPLAYLPFEALRNSGRYLIESHRIKYEPSFTGLTLLKEPEQTPAMELLAVAGSQFGNGREGIRRSSLSALPSTLTEVDSIASHFQRVSVLKDDGVSEERIKELLRGNSYRYIHLASHGIIDEDRPARSGLQLSPGDEITASSKEDGMLRSSEIYGLNLTSDMVVLSACNTGLGKLVKGEGMLGLQRSFFYAGVSTVVVSLWSVYDRSTANFMNIFYRNLLEEHEKEDPGWWEHFLRWTGWEQSIPFGYRAAAMHRTKLEMIRHPLFNHPVYWAPFIVVGR